MEEDFGEFVKSAMERKKVQEEAYKEVSKERLFNASKKKIQTTMIGALETIEKNFGFLWDFHETDPNQKELKLIFDKIRSEILDRGNTQIRNLETEFNGYDINYKKYSIKIPFRRG